MSIYINVREQDLINLRELAELKKRTLKIENRILKQTHPIKIAENFSPITKKFEEVNDTTQKIKEILKKIDFENETPQLTMEKTQSDIQPGVIYDISLRNALSTLRDAIFF